MRSCGNKISVSQNVKDVSCFTFENISERFNLSQQVVAKQFNMSLSTFRRKCHSIGIKYWPYKKVFFVKITNMEQIQILVNKTKFDKFIVLHLILNFLKKSPRNVNAFTALRNHDLTWNNFQLLVHGVPIPKILVPKAIILPPFKEKLIPMNKIKQEKISKPSKMKSLPFFYLVKQERL